MKAHLAKLSLALLSTVFLLGCQDMGSGPVGPEGPQFNKPDPITGLHNHGDKEPTEVPKFTVKVTGDDIFSTDAGGGNGVLYDANGNGVTAMGFQMDISSILDAVTCAEGHSALPDVLTGNLVFGNFLNDHIALNFDHNRAGHWFQMGLEDLPETWPATMTVDDVFVTQSTGEWSIQNQGKNHRDGCTGEGVGIEWEATVTRVE